MTEPPVDPRWSPPGGWTLDTLCHHLVTIMNEREKRLDERQESHDKAASRLAEELAAYKFQSNEWRGALSDQATKMMPRAEFEASINNINTRIDQNNRLVSGINDRLIPIESRSGYANITMIISGLAVLLGVAALVHPFFH